MKFKILLASLFIPSLAWAGSFGDNTSKPVPGVAPMINCTTAGSTCVPLGTSNPLPTTEAGHSGTITQTSVSVTNASTTILTAATANNFIKVCVAGTAANGIWVRWDGTAATLAAPAEYIPQGSCSVWLKATGYLPTQQINGIASATVAVSVIYN